VKAKQGALPIKAPKQKLTGFDGSTMKVTTPKDVQDAALEYFDRKSELEKAKENIELAVSKIEGAMNSHDLKVVVVRSMGGESMTCRIKSSSKLEIKKLKV
jgi:ABC-type xylose transport system substrate-binding protein